MLDPRLLRSFLAIVDSGNFTHAAQRLNMTQSTISQQLARLEAATGQILIDRAARPVHPTPIGERLIGHARRILALQGEAEMLLGDPAGTAAIRIGLPEDLATAAMATGFARIAASHPAIRLDVTTGLSRPLMAQYRAGDYDLVVVKEAAPGADARASFAEPLGWFTGSTDAVTTHDPLPLVTFPPGGLYRDAMFEQLEREGRRWFVSFSGSSLQSVLAAVNAGLGVSLLPIAATRASGLRRTEGFGAVAPMRVSLYARAPQGMVADLAGAIAHVIGER